MQDKRTPPGIEAIHSRLCSIRAGGSCDCEPTYRAWVYRKPLRKGEKGYKQRETFTGKGALTAAKRWREDATSDLRRGKLAEPSRRTLREVADEWLAGAKAEPPTVLNKSEQPYKPSTLRGIEADLNRYVLDEIGAYRLSELRRGHLQTLIVDRLRGDGLGPSKIRNVIVAVRVLFRYAIERDYCETNPTTGLRLGNGIGHRDRAASAEEAADLLDALPLETGDDESEKPRQPVRPVYATAFYAGLRRGELRALKWSDVDLAKGIITVQRGWDEVAGAIEPKSRKGTRTVPIVALLRDHLTGLKARTGRDGDTFVFGPAPDRPFTPNNVRRAAAKAWSTANEKRAEHEPKPLPPLVPIGLHECRHTFVSLLHDAGLPLERIGDYVGHSSTYMTDRYRHLLEGHEAESARMIDEYLARADSRGRIEQLDGDGD
jgi:integrase